MPKQIYNEGRVVGLSGYEIYVRQHLQDNPDLPPASEKEWLASTISTGSSMVLHVRKAYPKEQLGREPGVEDIYYLEWQLPRDTRLCAANTLIAQIFIGEAYFPANSDWATRIISYGHLITNTTASHPNGTINSRDIRTKVPHDPMVDWTDEEIHQLQGYLNILDGTVIQPGTWRNAGQQPPRSDIKPDMGDYPSIRIMFKGPIKEDFQIFLTGFTIRAVVGGVSGFDSGATDSFSKMDGDFLGPAVYPWSNKIMFCVPTSIVNYFLKNNYKRKIPKTGEQRTVIETALIDMQSSDPKTYYKTKNTSSQVSLDVKYLSTFNDAAAVLTTYQRSSKFPAAMFGTKLVKSGKDKNNPCGTDNQLNPIDCIAPNTLKFFGEANSQSATQAHDYEIDIPNNFAFYRKQGGKNVVYQLKQENKTELPVAITYTEKLSYDNPSAKSGSTSNKALYVFSQTGDLITESLSMYNGTNGTQYQLPRADRTNNIFYTGVEGAGGTGQVVGAGGGSWDGYISWAELLAALANNAKVDLIQPKLRTFKDHLPDIVSGPGGVLKILGTGESEIAGCLHVNGTATDTSSSFGDNSHSIVSKGSILCNKHLYALNNVIAQNGNVQARSGNVIAKKNVTAETGYVQAQTNVKAVTGEVRAKTQVVAETQDVIAQRGTVHSGKKYMEFNNLRLYICSSNPGSDDGHIPVGSIGIGWYPDH